MTSTPSRDRHRLAVKAVTGLTLAGAVTTSALLVGTAASDAVPSPPANRGHSPAGMTTGHHHAAVGPGGRLSAAPASAVIAGRPKHHHHHHHHHVPSSGS